MAGESLNLEDLKVARVGKTDLKALLCDFTEHGTEMGKIHQEIRESKELTGPSLKEWMLRMTEAQTLVMTGVATLLQIQVNYKDDFNEEG